MALTKSGFKTNLVSFWRQKKTVEEEEKRKREKKRRGRKKKKRKSKQSQAPKRYGTTNLEYGAWIFGMDPWFCLVNGYLLYPNLGFVRISS